MDIFQKLEKLKRDLKVKIPDIVVGITSRNGNQTYPHKVRYSGDGKKYESGGEKLIDVAIQNEYGVSGEVPPRPFIKASRPQLKEMYREHCSDLVEALAQGKDVDIEMWARDVGEQGVTIIRNVLDDSKSWAKKNADLTVELKGGDVPLFDTGKLRQGIEYELR